MSKNQSPTLKQMIVSVFAAFFGVQSRANRERDFAHGKPHQFIIIGVVATIAFIILLWLIVKLVLSQVAPS